MAYWPKPAQPESRNRNLVQNSGINNRQGIPNDTPLISYQQLAMILPYNLYAVRLVEEK